MEITSKLLDFFFPVIIPQGSFITGMFYDYLSYGTVLGMMVSKDDTGRAEVLFRVLQWTNIGVIPKALVNLKNLSVQCARK